MQHPGRFVAIEPESGEYFLADTLDAAVQAARARYPAAPVACHPSRICRGHPPWRCLAVTGHVDDQLRALVRVPVAAARDGHRQEIVAWLDTAFNGGLTIPRALINSLGLLQESSIEAVLADGRTVALETFGCHLDWFGETYQTQVVASDGPFPLLGTQLLAGRRLAIDYATGTVELT